MRYLILLSFLSSIAAAEPVVIVNTSNSVSSLSTDQVSDIFLKKQTTFNGGVEAIPINLNEGNPTRISFYEKHSQKSPTQLKAYWAKSVFTGDKKPPKEFSSPEEIKKFISTTPGGIAYIDEKSVDSTVKALTIK